MFSTVKLYLAGGVLILLLALAGYGWYTYSSLKTDLANSKVEIKKLGDDLKNVKDANAANIATIEQLNNEKLIAKAAIDALEKSRLRDEKVIGTLAASVQAGRANPANQVVLSPTLQDTVAKIQAERDKRRVAQ